MSPRAEDFQKQLNDIFAFGEMKGLVAVVVRSGDLHRLVGDYPGPDHRMPVCCQVMYKNKGPDDVIEAKPPKGKGANVIIRYNLPRNKKLLDW